MATILVEGFVIDGYQAEVRLVDGRLRTFHWLAKPANVPAAIAKAETDLKIAEIAAYRRARWPEDETKWLL